MGTSNIGIMKVKGRELVGMIEKKGTFLCMQETRWKGSKARKNRAGFKLQYHVWIRRVIVILKEEYVKSVVEVKRVLGRVMSIKMEIEGLMMNVVSGYA